jgi:hypothetical protein
VKKKREQHRKPKPNSQAFMMSVIMKTRSNYSFGLVALLLLMILSTEKGYGQIKVVPKVRAVNCALNTNGAISLSVTGGTPPYQFQWSHGNQEQDLEDLRRPVTDSRGLVTTQRIGVDRYSSLKVNILATNASAGNKNDGELGANVSGGKPPYQYHWVSLSNTEMRFPTSGSIHHLSAGNYMLAVQDANGCSAVVQAKVVNSNPAKK